VKDTMVREFAAMANRDAATFCSLATPAGLAKLAGELHGLSCPQTVALIAQHLSPSLKAAFRTVIVNKVTISGDSATVQDADITSSEGSLAGFTQPGSAPTMLQEQPDGSWKISG
jgi:hypothetical protein